MYELTTLGGVRSKSWKPSKPLKRNVMSQVLFSAITQGAVG